VPPLERADQPAARAAAMPRSWEGTASSGMAQAPPWMRRMGLMAM
jgi:hypothetical protein